MPAWTGYLGRITRTGQSGHVGQKCQPEHVILDMERGEDGQNMSARAGLGQDSWDMTTGQDNSDRTASTGQLG